jgi:hypothetical protein
MFTLGGRTIAWLFVLTATCALLLAWLSSRLLRSPETMVASFRRQVASASDEELPSLMRQAARLGESGIPLLVESLTSDRVATVEAAKGAIDDSVATWRGLSNRESSVLAAGLASHLALKRADIHPRARRWAANLTTNLLTWRIDPRVADSPRFVADCEAVIRHFDSEALATEIAPPPKPPVRNEPPARSRPVFLVDDDPTDNLPTLHGGGLPVAVGGDRVGGENEEADDSVAADDAGERNQFAPVAPETFRPGLSQQIRKFPTPEKPEAEVKRLAGRQPAIETEPAPHVANLPEIDVMRQLHAVSPRSRAAAEAELTRRGFDPLRVRLGFHLTHPEARVRRQLAETLPRIQGVDAKPWLLLLAKDDDATVRRASISVIATMRDVALRNELRTLLMEETDRRVANDIRRAIDVDRR